MCLRVFNIVVLQRHGVNLLLICIFIVCPSTWHANSKQEKLLHGLPNLLLQAHFMYEFGFGFAFICFLQLIVEHIELLLQPKYFLFIKFQSHSGVLVFILVILAWTKELIIVIKQMCFIEPLSLKFDDMFQA